MKHLTKTGLIAAAALLAGTVQVAAQVTAPPLSARPIERPAKLAGTLALPITSLREEISPVNIRFGELIENTGPISLMLAPETAREARIVFDFDKMTVTLRYQALVQAELLRKKGAPPMRLDVTETGAFELSALAERPRAAAGERSFAISFSTSSTGVFGDKPLAGGLYRQKKHCVDCCSYPQKRCRSKSVVVIVDAAGRVLSGRFADRQSSSLNASAEGQIEFQGQIILFTGRRFGTIGAN